MQQVDSFFPKVAPFPEFSKLILEDRQAYNDFISKYPPIADISFAILMNWWNAMDALAISKLNDNLIISYYLPEFEKYSGLSIIGTNKIDETLCMVFDFLKERGERPRLVNVPEFVMANIRYPELFISKEQRALNEYIFSVDRFCSFNKMISHRRWAVNKVLRSVGEENIVVKSVDLSRDDMKELLLQKASEWYGRGAVNTTFALDQKTTKSAIVSSEELGFENVCIFVKGELQAFCLYQLPNDENYVLLNHARISYEIPHFFEFAVYSIGTWFKNQGVVLVNTDSDLGFMGMRMVKVALGPTNFFRKYTIEPANEQSFSRAPHIL